MAKFYGHKKLDKYIYEKYIKDKNILQENKIIMEAGAMNGINLSTNKFFEEIGWECINIEANPDVFNELIANRPKATNINIALSNNNNIKKFEYDRRRGFKNGRIITEDAVTDELKKDIPNIRRRRIEQNIQAITYKELIKELNISYVGIFILDVEGHEIRVFDGMKDCDILPDIFCIEVCPSIDKIENYEEYIRKTFNNLYKKDGKCWINDIYIKQEGFKLWKV